MAIFKTTNPRTGRSGAIVTAASLAMLVTEIAAVVLFLSALLTINSGERLLEDWHLLAPGWGATHHTGLIVAAAVPTVLVGALLARWFYRRALAVELGRKD